MLKNLSAPLITPHPPPHLSSSNFNQLIQGQGE
jgi:hypothetical protein